MKIALTLTFLTIGAFAIIVWAKTEDPTSLVKPVSLYGTVNGALVPIKLTSVGALVLH